MGKTETGVSDASYCGENGCEVFCGLELRAITNCGGNSCEMALDNSGWFEISRRSRLLGGHFGSVFDSIQMGLGAEIEGLAGDGGGGHEAVIEPALAEPGELSGGGDDRGLAFLTEEVKASLRKQRGGGVVAADALVPDDLAGGGVPAGGDTAVVLDGEEEAVVEGEGRLFGDALFCLPGELKLVWRAGRLRDVGIEDFALSPRVDGEHLSQ